MWWHSERVATLATAEQNANMLEQLATFFTLQLPYPSSGQAQQIQHVRDEASIARLKVSSLVHKKYATIIIEVVLFVHR